MAPSCQAPNRRRPNGGAQICIPLFAVEQHLKVLAGNIFFTDVVISQVSTAAQITYKLVILHFKYNLAVQTILHFSMIVQNFFQMLWN